MGMERRTLVSGTQPTPSGPRSTFKNLTALRKAEVDEEICIGINRVNATKGKFRQHFIGSPMSLLQTLAVFTVIPIANCVVLRVLAGMTFSTSDKLGLPA